MKTAMRTVVLLTVLCTCCWSALNESHVPTGHSDLNLTDQVMSEDAELRAEIARLKTSDRKLKDVMEILLPLSQQWRTSTPKDWSRVLRRLLTRLHTVSVAQDKHSADLQALQTSTNKLRSRLTKQHAALLSLTQGQDKQQNGLDTLTQGQAKHQSGLDTLTQGQAKHQSGLDTLTQGQAKQQSDLDTLTQGQAKQQSGLDTLTQGQAKQQSGLDTLTQGQAKQQSGLDTLTQETQELRKENKEELQTLKTLLEEQQKSDVNISHLEKGQDELEKGQDELEKGQDELKKGQTQLKSQLNQIMNFMVKPSDCSQVKPALKSGVYELGITPSYSRNVYCDGNWTVIQRRQDGKVDFYRGWADYKVGFGDVNGNYWLGLETIHQLTSSGSWQLRVDLEDWERKSAYALYSGFTVGPETDNYRLRLSKYLTGTAGDSLGNHNGQQFTTNDRDHDANIVNCAAAYKGAWWYNSCHTSNLNGQYKPSHTTPHGQGLIWFHWKKYYYSLKTSVMKIRPV